MCGICGTFGEPDRGIVERMASAMTHRGPDDSGFFVDDTVALGFRRLSIIDVAGGHQPLENEDQTVQLIFNGEIYNHRDLRRDLESRGHRFRSGSDGEVIVHLYEERGTRAVDDLNGIFAFALWDQRAERLLLARDPHGVKPLYWTVQHDTFLFASELKAILASGRVARELEPEAVGQYLQYQAVPAPLSMVAGVHQLEPGRLLQHTARETTQRTYWTPPREDRHAVTSVDEATEIVRDGLEAAVRRQMMSERPLGVFLSGGVDSSALVALASRHSARPLKTFSVGFVGPDEAVLSEWPWARIVAERYETDHHELVLTEDMFREALPHAVWAMDQPTSDGINSYWVSHAASEHVTVALSGTGGDELFLGYDRDAHLLDHAATAGVLRSLPAGYVRRVVGWLDRLVDRDAPMWDRAERLRTAARTFACLDREFVSPHIIGIFDESEARTAVSADLLARNGGFAPSASFLRTDVPADLARPGDWISRLEQRGYLSYVLLRDIDAMSMAHSLEVRVPFLDLEFAADVARVPWHMKYRNGTGKWILKHALRDLLPDEILFRRKMGFGLPYNTWMRRTLRDHILDVLSPLRVRRRGAFDVNATETLVGRFYAGDDTVWRKVWTLFILESWATDVLDASGEGAYARAA